MASGETTQVEIIYVLYLAGFVFGITPIIGLVMAYMARGGGPEWLESHYTYAIRTFWIGLLYGVVASLLTVVLIGFLLYVVIAIWFIVRCVKGLMRVDKEQPIEDPATWFV